MEIEKKQGLGRVVEVVAKAAEKFSGETPAEKPKHQAEKSKEQKKASKKSFVRAPQEMLDTLKQKMEQHADSELVKKIKERTQPQDQRVVSILNELLTVEETNKDYPHEVEAAARRLKDLALEFISASPEIQVAQGGEVVARDARRCLRQLVEAYPEYKEKLEPIMLEAMPVIKGGASPRAARANIEELHPGDWLLDKDAHGNPIKPQHILNADGSIARDRSALQTAMEKVQKTVGRGSPQELQNAFNELKELPKNPDILPEDIESYVQRIVQNAEIMEGARFELTAETIEKIRDPKTRDEVFFARLKPVLDSPDTESHKSMNLYRETELEAFMHVVGELPGGQDLVNHYENLKHAVFAFHDLDYYARHASGDIKSFKIAAHYFHNSYAEQALSDPLVECMLQSYEQALKMIRDNNDGYIPPDLVGYSVKTHINYWDELAKQIFEKKVKAGLIHDYARDEHGLGKLKREERIFEKGEHFTEEDFDSQHLRVLATMRMAKGMGMLQGRLLEIFAFSKVPGMVSPEWGTDPVTGPAFSSIAYEGIARWFNPMGNFFGKFKPGESLFQPLFGVLVGLDQNELADFISWSPHKWEQIANMASEGTLQKWLQDKWGPKAGRMLDLVSEFAFSGRFGPLSGWGEHDATLGFTDLDQEREGGSLRLFKAKGWAEERLKAEFGKEWGKMKNTKAGQEKLETYARGYQAWVWMQTTLRSPTIIASAVRDPSETYVVMKETMPKRLRSVVIKQILGIDIERDVKSERTPDQKHRELMGRIELLESDVMTVQQAALYGGKDWRPRDIEEKDFDVVKGDKDGISEATRRAQAKQYCELVKKKMLGNWDRKTWEAKLGFSMSDKGDLTLAHAKDADTILGDAKSENALLTKDLLDKRTAIHMGMEDVQWRYLDLATLGTRHWARRANDLEARSNAIIGMMKYIDALRPKPDLKEIGKLLEDIKNAEKEHFPDEANKFVYYMSRGTGEIYRQQWLGMFPILGKILPGMMGRPLSIAQQAYGTEFGAVAWSSNNMREFLQVVQQATKLPYREIDPTGKRYPYNMERLKKELLAGRGWAIGEIVLIGGVLAALGMASQAFKKAGEEEER